MTQFVAQPEAAGATLIARLARYFQNRPSQWIDGRTLANVGGTYAWRSRISDLRRPPFNLTIRNRQRHLVAGDGSRFTLSEYAFMPEAR